MAAEVCHASKYTSNHGQEILDMEPIDEIDQESFGELKNFHEQNEKNRLLMSTIFT